MLDQNSRPASTLAESIDRLMQMLERIGQNIASAAETAERNYHRSQLLAAYKRRHSWKKSDIRHLMSLDVNKCAMRRMERLSGKGRPVVKASQPLDQKITAELRAFQLLFDPATPANTRKRALKEWPWWAHYVEALYRGEHALAKERGIASPSDHAEQVVGDVLAISAAKVHSICGDIRRIRREDGDSANFPSMTLAEFENWMALGLQVRLTEEGNDRTLS